MQTQCQIVRHFIPSNEFRKQSYMIKHEDAMYGILIILPEDPALYPPWMDHQQLVSKHEPSLSQQTHRTLFRVHMFVTQHSNIVPECHKQHQSNFPSPMTTGWFTQVHYILYTWLKNKAKCASSTAWSTSASSHTINGDFPPSSKVTGLRLLFAANSRTTFPVSVEPVKASCDQIFMLLSHYRVYMSDNPNKYHIRTWNFYTRQGNWNWLPWQFICIPKHYLRKIMKEIIHASLKTKNINQFGIFSKD